jgi:hypothetical protein
MTLKQCEVLRKRVALLAVRLIAERNGVLACELISLCEKTAPGLSAEFGNVRAKMRLVVKAAKAYTRSRLNRSAAEDALIWAVSQMNNAVLHHRCHDDLESKLMTYSSVEC